MDKTSTGHAASLFTILVWGTTFTSTKLLLRYFTPTEIQIIRNSFAFLALFLLKSEKTPLAKKWHELLFAGAGICGITLYYVFENNALSISTVANTSLIVATSPLFTALLSLWFLKAERPGPLFYVGFLTAISGIAMISINGLMNLQLNPLGDLLALGASVAWAAYSIFTKKLSTYGYDTVRITRRVFGYGLLFSLPLALLSGFRPALDALAMPVNLFNILFLSLCASALCFVAWNFAVKMLGAVRTSVYIYLVPVVSVTTSAIVLGETVTWMLVTGAALTLLGLFLSELKSFRRQSR
ncbi:MAG: DMT family transporter [Clostridiales bacterium]|nr:DMT family transporter [Clostridiales bacterium]